MSSMRVTHQMLVERSISNMQRGLSRLGAAQEAISGGSLINKPSDSPSGTERAMALRDRIATQARYRSSAQDGLGWLSQVDSTLSSMTSSLQRVRDLTVRGSSTGGLSDANRQALAAEVTALREGILGQANQTYLGRPVFGGTTAGTHAYDPTGVYLGDGGQVSRVVGDGVTVPVNVTGTQAFGSGGPDDLFVVLGDIAAMMVDDPAALSAQLDRLDTAMERVTSTQATAGARYNQLTAAVASTDLDTTTLTTTLGELVNVDLPRASIELGLAEVGYQGALAATSRVIQPSLVQFLR